MQVNTIIHGDCLEVMPQLPNGSVDMILCDLPYGTTACKWDTIIPFEPLWKEYKRIIKDNGAIVLTASQPFTSALVMSNVKMFKYEWIWEKAQGTGHLLAKKQPLKSHENILVFYKRTPTYNAQFGTGKAINRTADKKGTISEHGMKCNNRGNSSTTKRYPRTNIYFSQPKSPNAIPLHPTQKPVALFEYLIKTYTNENDLVLDNCAGSGTTGVACKNLNRNFILIEKDLGYFNIAQTRIAAIEKQTLLFDTGNLHKHNERLIA